MSDDRLFCIGCMQHKPSSCMVTGSNGSRRCASCAARIKKHKHNSSLKGHEVAVRFANGDELTVSNVRRAKDNRIRRQYRSGKYFIKGVTDTEGGTS